MAVSATTSKTINAPKDIVWEVLDDFPNIAAWSAGIQKSYTPSGAGDASTGVGAERVCELGGSKKLEERITAYSPGESMTINVHGVHGLPVRSSDTTFSVKETGDGKTEARVDAELTPKLPGFLVKIMGGLISKQVAKQFGGLLDELGTEAERRAAATS